MTTDRFLVFNDILNIILDIFWAASVPINAFLEFVLNTHIIFFPGHFSKLSEDKPNHLSLTRGPNFNLVQLQANCRPKINSLPNDKILL